MKKKARQTRGKKRGGKRRHSWRPTVDRTLEPAAIYDPTHASPSRERIDVGVTQYDNRGVPGLPITWVGRDGRRITTII